MKKKIKHRVGENINYIQDPPKLQDTPVFLELSGQQGLCLFKKVYKATTFIICILSRKQ
jgi:hypothetical protein